MSDSEHLTKQQYLDAIADISAAKHVGIDNLLENVKGVRKPRGLSKVFRTMFKGDKQAREHEEVANLLSLMTLKYDFKSQRLAQDDLGQWQIADSDWPKLVALYQNGDLQALVQRVKDDEALIEQYAKQDYIPPEYRRRARDLNNASIDYSVVDEPKKKFKHLPAVRNEDIVKHAKEKLISQTKRYERSIAKQQLTKNRREHQQLMEKLKKQRQRQKVRYQKSARVSKD